MADTHYNRDLVVANILFGANFSFYVSLTGGGMDFRLIFLCQILVGVVVFVPAAAVTRAFYRLTLRDAAVMALVTLLIVYGWLYMLLWGASLTSPIDAAVNTVLIKPQLTRLGVRQVLGWCYLMAAAAVTPLIIRYASADTVRMLSHAALTLRTEILYLLIFGTVLPIYLLYRGAAGLTSVHTALYRYIQPVTAGILAVVRGQAVFDTANVVALVFIFAGVVLVVIGYKYYVRHGLPPVGSDGKLRA